MQSLRVRFAFLWLAVASIARAQNCTEPPKTLTGYCSYCSSYDQLCLAYNVSDAADCSDCVLDAFEECSYQCLDTDALYQVTILIPFGSYQSDEELQERKKNSNYDALIDAMPDKTYLYPSVNNDDLTTIDSLNLDTSTGILTVAGGTDPNYAVKGKVVNVSLDTSYISSNVYSISFINMNLKNSMAAVSSTSYYATTLNLTNCLLSDLSEFTYYWYTDTMDLSSNYFTNLSSLSSSAASYLKRLYLRNNQLDSVGTTFYALEQLDLRDNQLTEIPFEVFSMSTLQYLYMDGNPLVAPNFTTAQYEFLSGLWGLDLTPSSFSAELDCDTSNQEYVSGLTVCITDRKNHGSKTGVIVGVIIAVLVVCVFALYLWRRRAKKLASEADEAANNELYVELSPPHAEEATPTTDAVPPKQEPKVVAVKFRYIGPVIAQ